MASALNLHLRHPLCKNNVPFLGVYNKLLKIATNRRNLREKTFKSPSHGLVPQALFTLPEFQELNFCFSSSATEMSLSLCLHAIKLGWVTDCKLLLECLGSSCIQICCWRWWWVVIWERRDHKCCRVWGSRGTGDYQLFLLVLFLILYLPSLKCGILFTQTAQGEDTSCNGQQWAVMKHWQIYNASFEFTWKRKLTTYFTLFHHNKCHLVF